MEDCLFCKIVRGEIPSEKVYEDEEVYAFSDIQPQAPHHVLIIPKKHVDSLMAEGAAEFGAPLFRAARRIAEQYGVGDNFRCVFNTGACGDVDHLHMHFLAGREFTWPPG